MILYNFLFYLTRFTREMLTLKNPSLSEFGRQYCSTDKTGWNGCQRNYPTLFNQIPWWLVKKQSLFCLLRNRGGKHERIQYRLVSWPTPPKSRDVLLSVSPYFCITFLLSYSARIQGLYQILIKSMTLYKDHWSIQPGILMKTGITNSHLLGKVGDCSRGNLNRNTLGD